MATTWLDNNMQETVGQHGCVCSLYLQQQQAWSRKGVENTWSLAMDKLVGKMVVINDASMTMFKVAAIHHFVW